MMTDAFWMAGLPVPSISWPLVIMVVPVASFMLRDLSKSTENVCCPKKRGSKICLFVRQLRRFLLPHGESVTERFSSLHGGLSMRIAALLGIILALLGFATSSLAATRKVVFLAGKKSHGPGEHEY